MSSDPITQLELARDGNITPEMRYVAEREQLALITIDIIMPDVDGWAFLKP